MLQELLGLMQKRAARMSDATLEGILERLRAALGSDATASASQSSVSDNNRTQRRRDASALAAAGGPTAVVRAITREADSLKEQALRSERAALQALKKLSDRDALQNPLRDAVSSELSRWRDHNLSNISSQAMDDRGLSDSLSSASSSPLTEALTPSRPQLQEALQNSLRPWCDETIGRSFRSFLQERTLPNQKDAISAAMRELEVQCGQALEVCIGDVREANGAAATKRFSEQCAAQVASVSTQELKKWQDSQRSARRADESAGRNSLANDFKARMRQAAAPLRLELDKAAADLASTKATLDGCRKQLSTDGQWSASTNEKASRSFA
jgi:hypothetical protein